jgi:hypothetical protein
MGQEIVYCAKCQRMLRGADFEKGAAFRVDSQAFCRACAPTLSDGFVPPPSRGHGTPTPKRGTSRIPLASAQPKPTQRHAAGPKGTNPLVLVGAAAGILVLLLIAIAILASGRPAHPARAEAPPAPAPPPATPAVPPAPAPRRVASERPPASPPPPAFGAKPAPLPDKSVSEQLAELDREIGGYLKKGEHPNALLVLEAARKRLADPAWTAEIDRRIGSVKQEEEKAKPKPVAKEPAAAPPPPAAEPPKAAPSARATFVSIDTATQGNWRERYGADGYELAQAGGRPPAYAQVIVEGQKLYTWAASSSEAKALEKPDGGDRLAACWYQEGSFTLEIAPTDEATHRVALYCVDWDPGNRAQSLEVLDAATGTVLDSRAIAGFDQGKYVVWDVKGRVRIRATQTGELNAVVSGIFFGGPASSPGARDPSLLLWLPFDEAKGASAADLSGQGNGGTVRGGAAWADGKSGKALRLDGRDDHVKVPDSGSINGAAGQITLSAWVYRSVDQPGPRCLIARQRGSGKEDQYVLGFRDNRYVFGVETTEGDRSVEGPVAPTAQWFHLAGTYDGTAVRLYMNGKEVRSRVYSSSARLVQEPKPVIVGAAQNRPGDDVQEAFAGIVDDVRIYARALGAAEVSTLSAGKPAPAAPAAEEGLVGHWSFDQIEGTTVRDRSPHANHGTLLNSPVRVAGRLGDGLAFDAAERQGVRMADSPSLSVTGPFTAAAWIKFTHREGEQVAILEKWDSADVASNGFMFRVSPSGKAKLAVADASGHAELTGRAALPGETWTHVAGVFDGTSIRLFVNGALDRSERCPRVPTDGPSPVTIGQAPSGGNRFTGAIDDVRLYSRALSEAEVAALAARPSVPASGLALWLRGDAGVQLEGGAVVRWEDQSGNDRHATAPAGGRPAYVKDPASGRMGLLFDGKNAHLSFTLPVNGLSGMTIFLVSACTQDQDGGSKTRAEHAAIFWDESASWGTVYLNPFQSRVQWRFGTSQRDNWPTYARPSPIGGAGTITTARKDGATDSLWVDGQLVMSESGKLPRIAACKDIATIGRGQSQKSFFAGGIAEVLVYTRALPDDERQSVERYLKAKYRK